MADGARVPERLLCERFGISRTPLREALKVLAAEGLIELLPNRGARVRVFSAEDLHELFDVMGGSRLSPAGSPASASAMPRWRRSSASAPRNVPP
ncbi:GntR family transcriptional regulator [Bosea thiooxidans]